MSVLASEVDGKVEASTEKLLKEKSINDPFSPQDTENITVKSLLQTLVTQEYEGLRKAFSVFDTKNNYSISDKDFRNTIEKYLFPLSEKDFEEILSKVLRNSDGTICYNNFLNQFCNTNHSKSTEPLDLISKGRVVRPFSVSPFDERKNNIEDIKQRLSEKFCKNVSAVLRAFHFFDYSRNGKISKLNFRKVLEKFDFQLTSRQFERLWQSENLGHSCLLDYKNFLQKLVTSGNISNSCSGNTNMPSATDYWDPKTGIVIQPSSSWPPYQKSFKLTADDEKDILRCLEIHMREMIYRHHYRIRKAFENADPKLQGFVGIEDLKKILETYMSPMSDELFGKLMKCLGIQPKGFIAWQVFLNKFRCPKDMGSVKTVDFMDIPREIIPLKNTNTYVDSNTVMFHLGQSLIHQNGSIENAFRKLDHRGRGWLTRLDVEAELKKLYPCLNEREYQEVCIMLDPEHRNKIYLPKFMEILKEESKEFPEPILEHIPVPPKTMSLDKIDQILKENVVSKSEELNSRIHLASIKDKGFLSSKCLKTILDTVVFPIEEQHFQSLLTRYTTPRKDGLIDCQKFFTNLVGSQNLFVIPSENFQETMPQNCCIMQPAKKNIYSRNNNNSSLVTAQRFAHILAEKSQKSGQNITKNQLTYRKAGKDILTLETLETLLKNFGICISGNELNKLWKRCDPQEKGYALYEDFLHGCGLEELYKRNNEVGSLGYILMWKVVGEESPYSVGNMSTKSKNERKFDGIAPEFLLREMIIKSPHNIWKAMSNLDMNKTGNILASDVQRTLKGYGLRMTDDQWNSIIDVIGTEGKDMINIKKFVEYVMHGMGVPDSTNSSQKFYTIQDVEKMLKPIVMGRKSDFLAAFRDADYNHLNVVCKDDFENILGKFNIRMDKEMFSKFWSTLPLNEHDNLIYKDFVTWFSNPNQFSTCVQTTIPPQPERPKTAAILPVRQAAPETLTWKPLPVVEQPVNQPEFKMDEGTNRNPSGRRKPSARRMNENLQNTQMFCSSSENEKPSTSGDISEKISKNLAEILSKLHQACVDEESFLPPEMLKSILESVCQPIDEDTFNSLLNQHSIIRSDGLVNYQEFLTRLIPWRSDSGRSLAGEIRRVIPSISAERNQPFQSVTVSQLPPLLARLTQNHFHNVTKGYLTFTKAGKDLLNMSTLKNFLKAFNISMNENEINKLWKQCDPEEKGYITYEEFLERCGLEEVYKGSSETGSSKYVIMWKLIDKAPYANMNRENTYGMDMMAGDNRVQLNSNLRERLSNMPLEIWKTILDLDVQKNDLVPAGNLQNLLANYGINLNDNEWKQVLLPFLNENGLVNIKLFISNLLYGKSESVAKEGQLTSMCMKEIEKIISTHRDDFLVAFKEADYAFLNTVSQESFQDILKKFGINMDQATFLKFWSLLPVNSYGNLMYQDFLNGINSQTIKPYIFKRPSTAMSRSYESWKPPGPHLPSTGRTSAEILPLEIHENRRKKRAATANATRKKERPPPYGSVNIVNAQQVEQLIKDVIFKNWKLIQKKCRLYDDDCTGYINPEKFKEILLQFMKNIQEEKFAKLKVKFDIKGNGTLAYKDLIRYFLFDVKPTRLTGQHRLLRTSEKDKIEDVPTEGLLGEALKRLRQCVIKNWRLMRRSFQAADLSKTDQVDIITFRQILKSHNVNLTEEEFFQIMSFYDKDFSASINYNSFLKAFLQNW